MKKLISFIAAAAVFAGCALISPYSIVFTTPDESVINPATDTLDLAINMEALAYVSGVSCEGYDDIELLPIVREDMEVSKAHNLSLGMLESFDAGTACEVTVTAFDKTTTATSYERITLYILEKPVEEEITEEIEGTDEDADTEVTEELTGEDTDALLCEDGSVCPIEESEDTNEETTTETGEDAGGEE